MTTSAVTRPRQRRKIFLRSDMGWPTSPPHGDDNVSPTYFRRAFFGAARPLFTGAVILKSSSLLPVFSAAASHLGFSPRPAHVSEGFPGLTNSELSSTAPTEVNRRVAPRRRPNAEVRSREHLTPAEVDAMIEAAKKGRHGHRDATAILVAFRHGLRAAELCDLRWDQVDFDGAVLHVRRVKNGMPSTHPIQGDELRSLRRLQRESKPSPYIFVSERGGAPFTTAGFARM